MSSEIAQTRHLLLQDSASSTFGRDEKLQESGDVLSQHRSSYGQDSGQEDDTQTRPLAVIGKYFVLETICESGQATVFRGLHPSLLVDVVIKLARRPWKHDETGRARLISEARALAEIVHPHLARLYDLDFHDDRPFLVLEYVRGKHLGQYRESARIDPGQIALLVAKIARAIAGAHERGILHLDLKPENVLITPTGEPVLIDFGMSFLSKSRESRSKEGRWIAGTPQYMAPEQTLGQRELLSQRTDVFGLGGILYYLCVGKDPFAVSYVDRRFLRPEEPDWAALTRTDVPARLKAICRKALASDPDARFDTAESLAERLEDVSRRWTGRSQIRLRRLSAMLFFSGVACLIASLVFHDDNNASRTSLALRASRDGLSIPLPEALPLKLHDELRLEGVIGESSHVAAFMVDKRRKPHWIVPLNLTPHERGVQVTYPKQTESFAIERETGPLLVCLVCRRHWPVRRSDANVIAASESLAAVLASLPTGVVVKFDRESIHLAIQSSVQLTDIDQALLKDAVEGLQRALTSQFDDFAGILTASRATDPS